MAGIILMVTKIGGHSGGQCTQLLPPRIPLPLSLSDSDLPYETLLIMSVHPCLDFVYRYSHNHPLHLSSLPILKSPPPFPLF